MTLRLLFFGTPDCCLPVLDKMEEEGFTPVGIVCQPDRPAGRGCKLCTPPTKDWARSRAAGGLPVLQPDRCRETDFLQEVRARTPDLGLVFAFGQLLPKALLDIPRLGFINIHPSLLPRYRGAAPIQWTLLNGDPKTGVSILRVTPKLDDGDIILQQETQVDPEENAVELADRLARLGGELVVQALRHLESGDVHAVAQDESQVVWAPALKKEDGQIDWSQPSRAIHNRIRGVQPWPGASSRLRGKILKIHRAAPGPDMKGGRPGEVVPSPGGDLLIRTGDGTLRLLEVQLEGKKRLPASAFLLGRSAQPGDVLD